MREPGGKLHVGEQAYEIQSVHARGGFATTYLATAPDGRRVIVKETALRDLGSWKTLDLFEREVKALARIDHPRVPRFEEAFVCQGDRAVPRDEATGEVSFVIVQEYVPGESLAARIRDRGALAPAEVERVFLGLLDIVEHLHAMAPPIVHRDIKPSNVILDEVDEPHLVDFGCVRDSMQGEGSMGSTVAGTLGYMPAEQVLGSARPSSDLYALAMTVLVAATGKEPGSQSIDDGTGAVKIPRATFSPAVERALAAMLEPAVGRRVANVAAVRALLARPPGVSRAIVAAGLAVAVLGGVGAGLLGSLPSSAPMPGQAGVAPLEVEWFARIRPHCNPVEVDTALKRDPPGDGIRDRADAAACLAIAGKIPQAKAVLDALPERTRADGANRLFTLVHPIADEGDDAATGPIMRLVLDYTPDNYMALYHAGIAEYTLGDPESARTHLRRFLVLYRANDGWVKSARTVLDEIEVGASKKCGEDLLASPEGRPIRTPACR